MRRAKVATGSVVLIALSALIYQSCKPQHKDTDSSEVEGYAQGSMKDCFPVIQDTRDLYKSPGLISWIDGQPVKNWLEESHRRDDCIRAYMADNGHAKEYGFNTDHTGTASDPKQNPALAWNWFSEHPIGFGGVPFVVLKTILDLNPNDPYYEPLLEPIYKIWHRPENVPFGNGADATNETIDHIGVGPHPEDYDSNGHALPPAARKHPLPNGLVYEGPSVAELQAAVPNSVIRAERLVTYGGGLVRSDLVLKAAGNKETEAEIVRQGLEARIKGHLMGEATYAEDLAKKKLQKPAGLDEVFFSCSGCHQGRVLVNGKMHFMPGLPNTEIEAQYYSKLLMLTAAEMVTGFDVKQPNLIDPNNVKPKIPVAAALMRAVANKARFSPQSFYGPGKEDIARAQLQAYRVTNNFPAVLKDIIGIGIKTHFIYVAAAQQNAYNQAKNPNSPDTLEHRPGQMDAFGIASGLVAIHSKRPDNSYTKFMIQQNPRNPITRFNMTNPNIPGRDAVTLGVDLFATKDTWLPQKPAAIDVRSLVYAKDNALANWDGNQAADARTLASGTSATGDPRKVNVRIHEPLNPFIDNLPPSPYPFDIPDLAKAAAGKEIYRTECYKCHFPKNAKIYSLKELEGPTPTDPKKFASVDANRSVITSEVSRYGLGAIVMEACVIYATQNNGAPGYNWCLPKADANTPPPPCKMGAPASSADPNWCKPGTPPSWDVQMDAYFKDIPGRVKSQTNGYKADVLHAIWGRAPYLHNGSVPTLGHLLCPTTRPSKFVRGNINYDEKMAGFEWATMPTQRYSPYETMHAVEFDTNMNGRHNGGHTFGSQYCPDFSKININDRNAVADAIAKSKAGDLIEFMKTL